ncbi:hypothetical protein N8B76_10690 [Enterococcus faecium]
MYKAYELDFTNADLNAFSSSSQSYTHVVNQIDHNQKSINKRIENLFESENDLVDYYSKDSKILDADEIIKDWFPTIKADIFISQTVDKVHFMDDIYSLFFYNRFMKTNARSDSYDV